METVAAVHYAAMQQASARPIKNMGSAQWRALPKPDRRQETGNLSAAS
jgi:hypothetical protein